MTTRVPPPRSRTVSRSPPHALHLAPRHTHPGHAHHAHHPHHPHHPHYPHYPHEAPPSGSRLVRFGQNLLPWVVALLGLVGAAALLAAPAAAQALTPTQ